MTLSPEDKDILQLFSKKAEELARIAQRVNSNCPKPEIKIVYKKHEPSLCTVTFPDEDLLKLLLMELRPLYMQGEPICFSRICNITWKYLDANDQSKVTDIRAAYREILDSSNPRDISLKHEGKKLTAGEILNLYINAYYFHTDLEKLRKLESIQRYRVPISKWIMICAVVDLSEIFVALNRVIEKHLK
jgi:hypothetical protein